MTKLFQQLFNRHMNDGEFVHTNGLRPLFDYIFSMSNKIDDIEKITEIPAIIKIEKGEDANTLILTKSDNSKETITLTWV